MRRFKAFYDGAASWSCVERVIARVEVGAQGPDTRFVVTNLQQRNARRLYEDVYCRRGQAENHIKSWKTHLAADRTSCTKATANQLRLFLHAGAYWIMWSLRVSMPKRSMRPSRTIRAPPPNPSSAGWNTRQTVPLSSARRAAMSSAAPSRIAT